MDKECADQPATRRTVVRIMRLPADPTEAGELLSLTYSLDWRVVGTLHLGDGANAVIMERDEP